MGTTTRWRWNGQVWAVEAGSEDAYAEGTFPVQRARVEDLKRALFAGEAVRVEALLPATPANPTPALVTADYTVSGNPLAPVRTGVGAGQAVRAGDVDEAGKARAAQKIAAAAAMGVRLPSSTKDGLFFDLGTAVMDSAWTAERAGFDDLPRAGAELPKLRAAIVAEQREEHEFPAWDLRMSRATGKVGSPADPAKSWTPTRRGFATFCSRARIGSIPEHWPTDIKAGAVNEVAKRFRDDPKARPQVLANGDGTEHAGPIAEPTLVLRTQKARGKLFAVVSPGYAAFDGDRIAEALEKAVPRDARVSVTYDPDAARGKVEIVTMQEEKPVVGEPFKTSFTVGWDDTGGGAVWGDGGLWSARCLNLTRIWTSVGTFRLRHLGDVGRLAADFEAEFDRIAAIVHQFADAYGHAASEELTNEERVEGTEFMRGVYRSLLQRELVPVRGKREEAVTQLALQAASDENRAGLTRAGIANGITRYAHRVNKDPWARDELERAAGRILWSPRPVKLDYLPKEAA